VLPLLHRDRYQQLLTQLQALSALVNQEKASPLALKTAFQEAKQVYQSDIMPLDSADVAAPLASRWQALQTELNRTFRLLQSDLAFLQAARQPATAEQRRASCQQHLHQAIAACEAAIAWGDDS